MSNKLFFIFALSITVLEILAYRQGGMFSFWASRIWLFLAFVYFLYVLFLIIPFFFQGFRKEPFWHLLFFFFLFLFVFWDFGSFEHLDLESTQQAAAGLANFKKRDWNYTGFSFLGYPARQYLLTAIPSLFWGRNLIALRLGFIVPFLLGVFLFYFALRQSIFDPQTPSLPLLATFSLFSFPYLLHYLRYYEQTIYPLSFTLQAVSWLILLTKRQTFLNYFSLMWSGSMLATLYTPGLAVWVLLIFWLFGLLVKEAWQKRMERALIFLVILLSLVVFGWCSFQTRKDISFSRQPERSSARIILGDLQQGYSLFFFSDKGVFIPPWLSLPLFVYLFSSLCFTNGPGHLLIALWSVLVVGVSVYLKGYASPPPPLALHRAMVIIPVLIGGMSFWFSQLVRKKRLLFTSRARRMFFSLLVITSLWYWSRTLSYRRFGDIGLFVEDLVSQVRNFNLQPEEPLGLVVISSRRFLLPLRDALVYFLPQHRIIRSKRELARSFNPHLPTLFYLDYHPHEALVLGVQDESDKIRGEMVKEELWWLRGKPFWRKVYLPLEP